MNMDDVAVDPVQYHRSIALLVNPKTASPEVCQGAIEEFLQRLAM